MVICKAQFSRRAPVLQGEEGRRSAILVLAFRVVADLRGSIQLQVFKVVACLQE
jgi:hypothetical protein